jgi:hypothetical protein
LSRPSDNRRKNCFRAVEAFSAMLDREGDSKILGHKGGHSSASHANNMSLEYFNFKSSSPKFD